MGEAAAAGTHCQKGPGEYRSEPSLALVVESLDGGQPNHKGDGVATEAKATRQDSSLLEGDQESVSGLLVQRDRLKGLIPRSPRSQMTFVQNDRLTPPADVYRFEGVYSTPYVLRWSNPAQGQMGTERPILRGQPGALCRILAYPGETLQIA